MFRSGSQKGNGGRTKYAYQDVDHLHVVEADVVLDGGRAKSSVRPPCWPLLTSAWIWHSAAGLTMRSVLNGKAMLAGIWIVEFSFSACSLLAVNQDGFFFAHPSPYREASPTEALFLFPRTRTGRKDKRSRPATPNGVSPWLVGRREKFGAAQEARPCRASKMENERTGIRAKHRGVSAPKTRSGRDPYRTYESGRWGRSTTDSAWRE